jgi:hypothetical protein
MTGKTEQEIVAEAEEEFDRRAAEDDPAGFVPHVRLPRARAPVLRTGLSSCRRLPRPRVKRP